MLILGLDGGLLLIGTQFGRIRFIGMMRRGIKGANSEYLR